MDSLFSDDAETALSDDETRSIRTDETAASDADNGAVTLSATQYAQHQQV